MTHRIQGWKIGEQRGKKAKRIPPFAPSKNELKIYLTYLKKAAADRNLPRRVLILGATPELRDGAIKFGLESCAVDVSREMMAKLSALMEFKNDRLDKRIIKDWLTMNFPDSYFGVIMGDASLNNLATREENEKLINICHKSLAKGGYLAIRQVVYAEKIKLHHDINKLIEDFRNHKTIWADFFMELRITFFKRLVYNQKTFQYDVVKNFELIDKLYKDKLLSRREYGRVNSFRNNIIGTYYPLTEFIKMVKNHGFRLEKQYYDKLFNFFKYFQMFVFKK